MPSPPPAARRTRPVGTPGLETRLDTLVAVAHDAALDARLWPGVAPRLAAAFGANSAALYLRDGVLGAAQALTYTEQYAGADFGAWQRHYVHEDLWAIRGAAYGPGEVMTDDQITTLAEMERTAWWTDWIRPFDVRHLIGVALPISADAFCMLGVHRAARLGPFGEAERRLLTAFLPHLRRALQVQQRLEGLALDRDAAGEAAGRSGTAALVVGADGRILSLSPAAERLLSDARGGLRVTAGRLAATAPATAERLRRLVAQAAETAAGRGRAPGGALLVGRGEDRAPLSLLVAPFRPAREGHGARAPAAIVFLRCPGAAGGVAATSLQHLYGLTPTEAAIAAALADGESVEAIAARFHITLNTARTHIKAVMAKTGTSRLPALVALLLRGAAALAAG